MTVYLQDSDVTIHLGDCLEVLRTLPDQSVHMACTSPPFYGLRDYGTGTWEGGDEGCDHTPPPTRFSPTSTLKNDGRPNPGAKNYELQTQTPYGKTCGKCGARRIDRQIGLEESPDEWVTRLVEVFREVRRVLRDDGVLFVEIGDSYSASPAGNVAGVGATSGLHGANDPSGKYRETLKAGHAKKRDTSKLAGVKPKDLLGQPWLLAFALRADGWYLRSEIIWHRPNPMPESVTDRPTKAHSTVFLLSKKPRYYFDQEAIREEFQSRPQQRLTANVDMPLGAARVAAGVQQGNPQGGTHVNRFNVQGEKLLYECQGCGVITTDAAVCSACGHYGDMAPLEEAPRGPDGRRVTHVEGGENSEQHRSGERWPASGANARSVWTIPTEPTPFAHFATWPQALCRRMILAGCPEGGVVLDCFGGSGTTALVARKLGRRAVLIELNESYCKLASDRLSQQSLFAIEETA